MTAPTRPAGPGHRLRWLCSDTWVLARRHLGHLLRKPDEVAATLLIPVLAVLLFGFVFGEAMGASMDLPGGAYREFLMPGLFALTMAFGIGNTTIAVVTDTTRGVVDRFRALPMSPVALFAGRALADVLAAVVDLLVLVGMGLLVGWRVHTGVGGLLAGLALLLLLRLAFSWVGIYLGLLVRSPEAAMKFFSLVFPLAMVADTFVPTQLMPAWLAPLAQWNPLSATVIALRELFGNPGPAAETFVAQHALVLAVAWPVAISAVFAVLVARRFRRLSR